MRGPPNVRAEFSLTALASNFRRALNILGVKALSAAVARPEARSCGPIRSHRGRPGPSQVA